MRWDFFVQKTSYIQVNKVNVLYWLWRDTIHLHDLVIAIYVLTIQDMLNHFSNSHIYPFCCLQSSMVDLFPSRSPRYLSWAWFCCCYWRSCLFLKSSLVSPRRTVMLPSFSPNYPFVAVMLLVIPCVAKMPHCLVQSSLLIDLNTP